MRTQLLVAAALLASFGTYVGLADAAGTQKGTKTMTTGHVTKSDAEWRKQLTPEQYHILREKGTERAGTGKYADNHAKGTYVCAGCGQQLFDSETKFESGTGWPSFFKPIDAHAVKEETDTSFFMRRTEVMCAKCDGHLGHVFNDGPKPTGLRYCMNSGAMDFKPAAR